MISLNKCYINLYDNVFSSQVSLLWCVVVMYVFTICVVWQCWDTKGGRSFYSPQEAFQFQIWQNNVMLSDVRKKPPDDGVKSEDGK